MGQGAGGAGLDGEAGRTRGGSRDVSRVDGYTWGALPSCSLGARATRQAHLFYRLADRADARLALLDLLHPGLHVGDVALCVGS